MGFQCGIVGLPNVGKSTLFNTLTKASVPAENYPFCTKDPNVGIVPVPDDRLDVLASIVSPEKIVPTTTKFVDIAGLVKGASTGEGLGNKFLANIRETDAIVHVVRCFLNDDIIHVAGSVDPLRDIEIINTELALADLEAVEKRLAKKNKTEQEILQQYKQHLNAGKPIRTLSAPLLPELSLLTAKPLLYVANINDVKDANNPLFKQFDAPVIPLCIKLEAELMELSPEDKQELLSGLGLEQSGLDQLIKAGYQLLNLETYFTAGVKEVRAWTIHKGNTAPQAAGVIHSDFEKGFIRAEVIAYNDFVQYKGEQGAKDAGKWRLEGKDYIVCEGDVIHFRFQA